MAGSEPGLITRTEQVHQVERCPLCGAAHDYVVVARVRTKPLAFGGPGSPPPAWDVDMVCPVTQGRYTSRVELAVAAMSDVVSVTSSDDPKNVAEHGDLQRQSWLADDLYHFLRDSRNVARDYCRTMVSTSFGAIPLFVGLVHYISPSESGDTRALLLAPPVLFLLAGLAFSIALQSRLVRVEGLAQYASQREAWHRRVHTLASIGLGLFVLGILLALVALWVSGWNRA